MKKTILNNFKLIAFTAVLAFGIGASAYSDPIAPPPYDVPTPVTALSTSQVKAAGLSVNAFSAMQDAQFQQDGTFQGAIYGGTSSSPATIRFGSGTNDVDVIVQGDVVAGAFRSDSLSNNDENAVCADDTGKIILCP